MSTIKCFNCGVTNWASAETCVRCKSKLEYYTDDSAVYSAQSNWKTNTPTAYEQTTGKSSFLRSPIVIISLIAVGIFAFYFVFMKSSSPSSTAKTSSDASKPAETEISVAVPPAEMNVTPPDLANFKTFIQNEINQNNIGEFSTEKVEVSSDPYVSPKMDTNAAIASYQKADQEARDRLGPCDPTINNCQQLLNQRKNQMISEQNQRAAFFGSSQTIKCPPKIEGEIKPVEPGTYHKFDQQIYYVTKVRADGLEGFEENGQCSYRPAIAGLTTQIYLKWQSAYGSASWQSSTKLEMQNVSSAYNKKKKEEAIEKREKAKNPKSGIF